MHSLSWIIMKLQICLLLLFAFVAAITSNNICHFRVKVINKFVDWGKDEGRCVWETQRWSERGTSVTTTTEMIRPVEMIESRVCPWLCVDSHAESIHRCEFFSASVLGLVNMDITINNNYSQWIWNISMVVIVLEEWGLAMFYGDRQ